MKHYQKSSYISPRILQVFIAITLLFSSIASTFVVFAASQTSPTLAYEASIGKPTAEQSAAQLVSPASVAVEANGNFVVADGSNTVKRYSADGTYLSQFGSAGTGDGQFNNPSDVDIDSLGNIYVTDTYNNRIQKFDSNGVFVLKFGQFGFNPGNLNSPFSLAIDSADNLYTLDGTPYVKVFTSGGTYISEFGSYGTGPGEFNTAKDIRFDADDNLYVADSYNNRIQKLTSNGAFISQFGSAGTGNGQFNRPQTILVTSAGDAYVSDEDSERVQKFDSSGNYVSQFGSFGSENGQFNRLRKLIMGSTGNILAVDSGNNRIQIFDATGNFVSQFGNQPQLEGALAYPIATATSSDGSRTYVTQNDPDYVYMYDSAHNYIGRFGSTGTGNGQFMCAQGVAVDKDNNVFVSDNCNNRVQKFTHDGVYISQFGTAGSGNGEFSCTEGIAFDSTGNIFVVDGCNSRVEKFDASGTYIMQFGATGPGQLSYPESIAIDSVNNMYVTDGNGYVQKFDPNGTHLYQIDGIGTDAGEFSYVEGLAVDEKDNVYISDNGNNTLHIFNADGDYLSSYGGPGSGDGQFDHPYYIGYTSGKLYIADSWNHRVQVISVKDAVELSDSSASVEGKSLLGNPTIDKRPAFMGTAPAGSTVTVTVHSDPVVCSATADADGNWSCTLPSDLEPGQHTVFVHITTLSGQILDLGPYIVTVGGTITNNTPLAPNSGVGSKIQVTLPKESLIYLVPAFIVLNYGLTLYAVRLLRRKYSRAW